MCVKLYDTQLSVCCVALCVCVFVVCVCVFAGVCSSSTQNTYIHVVV